MFSTPEVFSLRCGGDSNTAAAAKFEKAARCILIAKRLGLVVWDVRCDSFFFFF